MERLILYRVRSRASTKKIPTPIATIPISTRFGTVATWPASTCRSGSAMVMRIPITRVTPHTSQMFFVLGSCAPMPSPIGIMETSVPREKKAIPKINSTAPRRNSTRVSRGRGITATLSKRTIKVMGSTADRASRIFSFSILFTKDLLPWIDEFYNRQTKAAARFCF